MARFLLRIGGFAALQLAILCAVVWFDPGDSDLHELTNARHRLAAVAAGPRMIINGDSNTMTAFDSPCIHQATGLRPVNMGLGGGLRLDFILNETRDVARPGDTVVLSLEYEHFTGGDAFPMRFQASAAVVARRPQNLWYVPWQDLPGVLDALLPEYSSMLKASRVRSLTSHRVTPAIDRINEYGDVVPAPAAQQTYVPPDFSQVGQLGNTTDGLVQKVDELNEFVRDCRRKQVTVYLIYGPCEEHHFAHNREFIEQVHRTVQSRFIGVLLGSPQETKWPSSMFSDTHAHLNAGATRTHTERFLELFAARRTDESRPLKENVLAERTDQRAGSVR